MKTPARAAAAVVLAASALLATGCFSYKILEAPYASMTEDGPPSSGAKAGAAVSGRYCIGDPPAAKKGNFVGMIDEATLNAQKNSKTDYIQNAVYMKEGGMFTKTCVSVTGKGVKGKAASGKSAAGGKKKKKKAK